MAKTEADDDLLDATLAVAQTQLLAQIADETSFRARAAGPHGLMKMSQFAGIRGYFPVSLDGRTIGILAFNGALLAADVAAKELLGRWWWTPLVALGVSTMMCLQSVLAKDTNLGPLAITFYANYGGHPSVAAREQLLADLGDAFDENAERVKSKTKRLRWALGILVVGLVIAALMITA